MTDVTVNYTLPTSVRVDGDPMVIDHVRVEKRLEGIAEWTAIADVPASESSVVDQQVQFGRWHYRGIVVPTEGPESDPLEGEITLVKPLAKASPLVNLTLS